MSISHPFHKRSHCDDIRQEWVDEKLHEARIVVADVVHHSDHLLRMACNVLVRHGQTPRERTDARILLVVLDAKSPGRIDRHRSDPEVRR